MNFKENLRLGGGPTETKKDFFNKQQISVLGLAIIKNENNFIKTD